MKLFFLTLLLISLVHGQKVSHVMPEKASWKILITDKIKVNSLKADGNQQPLEKLPPSLVITVTKNKDVYHMVYSKKVNGVDDFWILPSRFYVRTKDKKRYIRTQLGSLPGSNLTPNSDLPDFLWVNESNFRELKKINDSVIQIHTIKSAERPLSLREESFVSSLMFQNSSGSIDPNTDNSKNEYSRADALEELGYTGETTAFVNAKTGLPILMKSSNLVIKLKKIPYQGLNPPPFIQQKIDFVRKIELENKKNVE